MKRNETTMQVLKKIYKIVKDVCKSMAPLSVEERKKRNEWRESVSCPFCKTKNSSSYCSSNLTKNEDVELKCRCNVGIMGHKDHSRKNFNFLHCCNCNELFGVKITCYYEPIFSLFRESFKLEDINEI